MYNVKFLPSAENEMCEIASYIASEFMNIEAAENLINAMMKARDDLKIFPVAHAVFKIVKSIEIRRVLVLNCSMFYVVDKDEQLVTIINVKHNLNDFLHDDTLDV